MSAGLAAALVVAACDGGGADGGAPTSAAPPVVDLARITPIAAGVPADRVTDVAAAALTQADIEAIEKECMDLVGVPGTVQHCIEERIRVSSYERRPCLTSSLVCIAVGKVAGSEDQVVQLIDQRPDRPACVRKVASLCGGAVASRDLASAVRSSATRTDVPPTTSVGAATSVPSETPEPTATEPTAVASTPEAPKSTAPGKSKASVPTSGPGS